MSEQRNAEIMYAGFDYYNFDFINSQAMQDFLNQHPYLKVVTETEDPITGEEVFKELTFPITDPDGPVMIMDERLDNPEEQYLLINHEDDAFIDNPSSEFVAILKMMQAVKAKDEEEMFFDQSNYASDSEEDAPSHWSWEFDFKTGKYIDPNAV